ncbi:MAG: agmatine deiminase family protein [Bacteroidetes bacterium]|nr:agmatine deiminase family protein [Bacteroidota bacterium]
MKRNYLLLLTVFFLLIQSSISGQNTSLTHHMTPEEELIKDQIDRDFYPTLPPAGPVRMVAEFEHMQAVLIRYPFGIPMSLIKEMSEDCTVLTVVANQSQENTVRGQYQSAGVNMNHVEFMHASTDSYWTRDYGPWFVVNGNNEIGVCNFPYNRPRPNDNDIPIEVAEYYDIELYGMELISTGGNYMCDGMGIAASSDLVIEENPQLTLTQINGKVLNYLGVHTYHIILDPLGEYIKHIDCWGKFLDIDKVLIGQVPSSDPRYSDFEYVADYFEQSISSYGTPYEVFRVFTPGNGQTTPYTNSLILNKKVFVPITGSTHDQAALDVYEDAMPGYEVIGVTDGGYGWENTDALHCRTKGVADLGMLYIRHYPLYGQIPQYDSFEITAEIIPYSDEPLYSDSLKVFYRVNGGFYNSVPLFHQDDLTYSGFIPTQPTGSKISYYLYAADESGRNKKHPYIGAADPHVFFVGNPLPELTVTPDSLIYTDYMQCIDGQIAMAINESDSDIYITNINNEGWDPFFWWIDPFQVSFPYLMEPGDTLSLNVQIGIPLDMMPGFLQDTLFVETEMKTHQVFILVDSILVSGLNEKHITNNGINLNIYPNPVTSQTQVSFTINETSDVQVTLFSSEAKILEIHSLGNLKPGDYTFPWNKLFTGNYPDNGIYLLRIETNNHLETRKIIQLN